ncbi:hypothetical protein EBR96_06370 [bacterium]|nr:hypothetical protein [bacterium]
MSSASGAGSSPIYQRRFLGLKHPSTQSLVQKLCIRWLGNSATTRNAELQRDLTQIIQEKVRFSRNNTQTQSKIISKIRAEISKLAGFPEFRQAAFTALMGIDQRQGERTVIDDSSASVSHPAFRDNRTSEKSTAESSTALKRLPTQTRPLIAPTTVCVDRPIPAPPPTRLYKPPVLPSYAPTHAPAAIEPPSPLRLHPAPSDTIPISQPTESVAAAAPKAAPEPAA